MGSSAWRPGQERPRRLHVSTFVLSVVEGAPPSAAFVAGPDYGEPLPGFDAIEAAVVALREGEFVVVLDDEDRENEGDLIIAAEKVTEEKMAFLVRHSSGLVCVGMTAEDLARLDLPLMVSDRRNEEAMYTAFTISVDAKAGTSTGISAADRALTVRALADPSSHPGDFNRPGHIFPLRARPLGVIERPGHTEASVDLARLAGCAPCGVLCEVVDHSTGAMMRTAQLKAFAKEHGLKCITIRWG